MDVYFILLLFLAANVTYIKASFKDEMKALEADIAKDETKVVNMKKSIKDLTTEELIAELERDLKGEKADTAEQKYRKRFESILEDQILDEERENFQHSSKSKREHLYKDVVTALYEDNFDEKKEIPGSCVDLRTDCNSLKSFCSTHHEKLRASCARTCKFCVDCKQRIAAKTCDVLKKRNKCNDPDPATRNRMITLCPITCGFCKVPAPPTCSATQYGCCWDKSTTKHDTAGTNCPACNDQYRYVCKTFKPDCKSFLKPGEFMRTNCPRSCGLCKGCSDSGIEQGLCAFWKKTLNWCVKKKDIMTYYCQATCDLCDEGKEKKKRNAMFLKKNISSKSWKTWQRKLMQRKGYHSYTPK